MAPPPHLLGAHRPLHPSQAPCQSRFYWEPCLPSSIQVLRPQNRLLLFLPYTKPLRPVISSSSTSSNAPISTRLHSYHPGQGPCHFSSNLLSGLRIAHLPSPTQSIFPSSQSCFSKQTWSCSSPLTASCGSKGEGQTPWPPGPCTSSLSVHTRHPRPCSTSLCSHCKIFAVSSAWNVLSPFI